jgi:predicted TIM-barrel fold metal-dependent hydrolase
VALESLVQPDQILFGTDFPAVSLDMAAWYTRHVDEYFSDRQDQLDRLMYDKRARAAAAARRSASS